MVFRVDDWESRAKAIGMEEELLGAQAFACYDWSRLSSLYSLSHIKIAARGAFHIAIQILDEWEKRDLDCPGR